MDDQSIIRDFYDAAVEKEWRRLEENPYEFDIHTAYFARYIKPGDRVLDCGGGPGRYSLWLAERGCDVTLCDLSSANAAFAASEAERRSLMLNTVVGDARLVDTLVDGEFDHVLLMGPLYHLLAEEERVDAVRACLRVLKIGGSFSAAFISLYGGMVFYLREALKDNAAPMLAMPQEHVDFDFGLMKSGTPYSGDGFTRIHMTLPKLVLPFFEQFDLQKLHLIGSEGVLAPFRDNVVSAPPEVYARLLDLALAVCEKEELLCFAEHLLYMGRKNGELEGQL